MAFIMVYHVKVGPIFDKLEVYLSQSLYSQYSILIFFLPKHDLEQPAWGFPY